MATLTESHVSGVRLLFRGKVRDVYDLGDELMLVSTDRLSAFDVILPTPIPDKGWVLTQLSNVWFERTKHICPNHVVNRPLSEVVKDPAERAQLEGRTVIGKKAEPLKIEAIVRGYLAGSGWSEYQERGTICGIKLPLGLKESDRLPEPIFTPSTKAPQGQHDENISFEQACDVVGKDLATKVRDAAIALYKAGAAFAEQRGIIVADTKFEFGMRDGQLIVIDEMLTPDSSRFWAIADYQPGRSQPSFDKQFVRDYLKSIKWNQKPPAPELPAEIAERTAAKYREAYDRLKA